MEDRKMTGSEFLFRDEYEKRVWVATFEVECKTAGHSQVAASNADDRLSLFRVMDPMVYATTTAAAMHGEVVPDEPLDDEPQTRAPII